MVSLRFVSRIGFALTLATLSGLAVALGCDSKSNVASTPVTGVRSAARAAASTIDRGVVQVNGSISQRDENVRIRIQYTSAKPDGWSYDDESTIGDRTSRISLISVASNAWTLEQGQWKPFTVVDAHVFLADRIWSLIPFEDMNLVGTERLSFGLARHYQTTVDLALPLDELAGSLIASEDASLTGTISHVAIDYWVDEAHGWPVKARYRGNGDAELELTAELENVNDPSIAVAPPRGT